MTPYFYIQHEAHSKAALKAVRAKQVLDQTTTVTLGARKVNYNTTKSYCKAAYITSKTANSV